MGGAAKKGDAAGTGACDAPQRVPSPRPRIVRLPQRKRVEIVSVGIDEQMQGVGSDPYGDNTSIGLRVPALATPDSAHRYLFKLVSFKLALGARARLVGFRHGWSLGVRQVSGRVVEQWVQNPIFKLPDGNISWHIRRSELNDPGSSLAARGPLVPPLANLSFLTGPGSSLLYQTITQPVGNPFYVAMTAYGPPNAGMPPGRAIAGDLQTFYDLKTDWRDASSWRSLDIPLEGPCEISFFASVHQGATPSAPALTAPALANFYPLGLNAEEQFLLNFPANIWRVAGAFAVEFDDDHT